MTSISSGYKIAQERFLTRSLTLTPNIASPLDLRQSFCILGMPYHLEALKHRQGPCNCREGAWRRIHQPSIQSISSNNNEDNEAYETRQRGEMK